MNILFPKIFYYNTKLNFQQIKTTAVIKSARQSVSQSVCLSVCRAVS